MSLLALAGTQTISTPEGFTFPLDVINGLHYLPLRLFLDQEWKTLPHVVLTSDSDWDPSTLDKSLSEDNLWFPDNTPAIASHSHGDKAMSVPTLAKYHQFD